jgi:hypothetical protein
MLKTFYIMSLLLLTIVPSWGQKSVKQRQRAPLVVGWHDEMNDPGLWRPLGLENQPDIYASRPGAVTLRLPHVPEGFPYAFQWSGVTRSISADLAHYPVLVARVSSLEPGTYAHLDIEERGFTGRVAHTWRSSTLTKPGLALIDLGKEIGPFVQRLTLRLIVGGKLTGAKCEYNWVRFARREDVGYLQEVPDLQNVTSREPQGDALTLPASAQSTSPPPRMGILRRLQTTGLQIVPGPDTGTPGTTVSAPRRIRFEIKDIVANVNAPQQQMDFFVNTGSLDAPLVTLADNAGFPDVQNIYARPKTVEGMQGVLVSLILTRLSVVPARAAFAITIWQPAMPGPCTVIKVASGTPASTQQP